MSRSAADTILPGSKSSFGWPPITASSFDPTSATRRAGQGRQAPTAWNNPPADYNAWYQFVYRLADALRDYPNVLSYEIYNEENSRTWWDGSIDQYKETLRLGALAVRAVNPTLQVLLGGAVFPDSAWLRQIVDNGCARYYDITPFHAYPETWINSTVENYLDAGYRAFVDANENLGEAEPIWINEIGFAATPEMGEAEQANWWARAVSTFLADPYIEHIGVYEIKDLAPGKETIGDEKNYYLGLTRVDRGKKLAFYTVALLRKLLAGKVAPADDELSAKVSDGEAGDLHYHLFKRADGKQVLFGYDKQAHPTIEVKLRVRGARAWEYELNGTVLEYPNFDGTVLRQIRLAAGNVTIFVIDP